MTYEDSDSEEETQAQQKQVLNTSYNFVDYVRSRESDLREVNYHQYSIKKFTLQICISFRYDQLIPLMLADIFSHMICSKRHQFHWVTLIKFFAPSG